MGAGCVKFVSRRGPVELNSRQCAVFWRKRPSIHAECMTKLTALTAERPTFGLPKVDYVAQYAAKCPADPPPPTPGQPHVAEPTLSAAAAAPAGPPKPVIHFPWPA